MTCSEALRLSNGYNRLTAMDDFEKPKSLARRTLPFVGVLIAVIVIYDGGIFYSRWSDKRDAQAAAAEKEKEKARATLRVLGSGGFKITSFYAAPGEIRAGEKAKVCYGVQDAAAVQLDPPVASVWPSATRCFDVSPRRDTQYKLTAQDAAGHTASADFTLQVVR